MSGLSRTKGKVGEREVCALLRPVFPNARRRLGQERAAQDNGRDLDGTAPLCIQVKRHKTITPALVIAAVREAESAVDALHTTPVACLRADRGRWRVAARHEVLDGLGLILPGPVIGLRLSGGILYGIGLEEMVESLRGRFDIPARTTDYNGK